jgi:hypothetical protein
MRPARRIKQAEDVADRLRALLSSSIISQLLQHTPPTALTAEQDAQLLSCWNVISQLKTVLNEAPSLGVRLVDAMLKQQVACNVGGLVMWAQQQPEQQLIDVRAVATAGHQGSARNPCVVSGTIAAIWAAGVQLLGRFAAAYLHNTESAGACSLAAKLTQQLDQSGKASCYCSALQDDAVVAARYHACSFERIEPSISRSVLCNQHITGFARSPLLPAMLNFLSLGFLSSLPACLPAGAAAAVLRGSAR